jgi:AraC-like DNA-binding protein
MKKRGVYGRTLGDIFRIEKAPTFTSRSLRHVEIGVTHIACNIENNGMTSPLPIDDAYLVTVQLLCCAEHDLWIDGVPQKTGPLVPGSVSIYDLRQTPIVNSISAFENLHFYLPRSALAAVSGMEESALPTEIPFEPGIGVEDPVLHRLGLSLLPSFERPPVGLFVDHITTAFAAYFTQQYVRSDSQMEDSVCLSNAQVGRAKEMLSLIEMPPTIAALARECGLSSGTFAKAFLAATGVLPHIWQQDIQVDRAKSLLVRGDLSTEAVAEASGFASIGQMEEVFFHRVGTSTQSWRYRG